MVGASEMESSFDAAADEGAIESAEGAVVIAAAIEESAIGEGVMEADAGGAAPEDTSEIFALLTPNSVAACADTGPGCFFCEEALAGRDDRCSADDGSDRDVVPTTAKGEAADEPVETTAAAPTPTPTPAEMTAAEAATAPEAPAAASCAGEVCEIEGRRLSLLDECVAAPSPLALNRPGDTTGTLPTRILAARVGCGCGSEAAPPPPMTRPLRSM